MIRSSFAALIIMVSMTALLYLCTPIHTRLSRRTVELTELAPPVLDVVVDSIPPAEMIQLKWKTPQPDSLYGVPPHRTLQKSRQGKKEDSIKVVRATPSGSRRSVPITERRLRTVVDNFIGFPYRYGDSGQNGMDCSGFVWRVFTLLGYENFPRTSASALYLIAHAVSSKQMKPGDLVFFKDFKTINHVGIFMGDNIIAHATNSQGITYTSLDDHYFKARYFAVRRMKR